MLCGIILYTLVPNVISYFVLFYIISYHIQASVHCYTCIGICVCIWGGTISVLNLPPLCLVKTHCMFVGFAFRFPQAGII